jgi:hypothetical protein
MTDRTRWSLTNPPSGTSPIESAAAAWAAEFRSWLALVELDAFPTPEMIAGETKLEAAQRTLCDALFDVKASPEVLDTLLAATNAYANRVGCLLKCLGRGGPDVDTNLRAEVRGGANLFLMAAQLVAQQG